jgi:uncharacterized membrane protein
VTRKTFIAALRDGLEGLPAEAVADVVGDYEAHIAEAQSRGRSEAEVVAALGDPARIAHELRAEILVRRWQVKRDPAAALQAVVALVGLGTANLVLLAPLLAIVLALLVAFGLTALGVIGSGALLLFAALSGAPDSALRELFAVAAADVSGSALLALALAASAVAGLAASLLLGVALVNAAVWYGRLHYRLIRPPPRQAVEPQVTKLTVIGS